MKYIISTLLILATLFSCSDDFDNVTLEMTTVAKGNNFPYDDNEAPIENIVITNSIHWNNIKTKIEPNELLEDNIDFNMYTVIAVIDEVQTSGGYDVEIESVVEHEDEVIVESEFEDGGDGAVTAVLTRPYHFIKVEKIDKTVEFSN